MNYVLFDDQTWDSMLPLTFTRPVSELRIGILTIKEKWDFFTGSNCSYFTRPYLGKKFKSTICEDNIFINSSFLPNMQFMASIHKLEVGQSLVYNDQTVAVRLDKTEAETFNPKSVTIKKSISVDFEVNKISYPWDIFTGNGIQLKSDFDIVVANRKSAKTDQFNTIINQDSIFIEETAIVTNATINASTGPVYIGRHAEIMEGALIRGPFALCDHSSVKMGAKIYGPTTIGPHCKVGGELNNCVFTGYSNKAHDGFLGNSVIGEWCNLGADTNSSNLKNNYEEVKVWNYPENCFIKTGLQFCGLIMGDHSKCSINTMFNTGTVVGVSANIFGSGFPRNFIPSFSWGGAGGFIDYKLNKALEVAEKVMARRERDLDQDEKDILEKIYLETRKNLKA